MNFSPREEYRHRHREWTCGHKWGGGSESGDEDGHIYTTMDRIGT